MAQMPLCNVCLASERAPQVRYGPRGLRLDLELGALDLGS